MTANVSFEVDSRTNALKIPNAALRFFPDNLSYVHPDDRRLLDGSQWASKASGSTSENSGSTESNLTASEQAESAKTGNQRHVWVVREGLLKAIPVVTGFSESRFTVIESGQVAEGDELVVGLKKKLG